MIAGLDIGGTKCAVVLGKEREAECPELVYRKEIPTRGSSGDILAALTEELKKQCPLSEIEGVGISCGGPLDAERGIVLSPPNLPDWREVPVTKLVTERTGAPSYLQNDADACALAEWKYGAGRGASNVIFLTFGTGLGAGLILDGKLYVGACGRAGEAGHVRLEKFGPVGYGKAGSFEGFCSGGGIAQYVSARVMEARQRGETLDFSWECGVSGAKDLGQAAEAGSLAARRIWEEIGEYFGRGLAILCDILNPERIVAGGVYMRSGKWMQEGIRRTLEAEALCPVPVAPAQLGEKIGDVAALTVAAYGLAQGKK